jgi:hypothetical protein
MLLEYLITFVVVSEWEFELSETEPPVGEFIRRREPTRGPTLLINSQIKFYRLCFICHLIYFLNLSREIKIKLDFIPRKAKSGLRGAKIMCKKWNLLER